MKRWMDWLIGIPLCKLLNFYTRKGGDIPSCQKILVIKLAAVGDTILLEPILRSLREGYPQKEIHFLGSSINYPFVKNFSVVNKYWIFSSLSPFSFLRMVTRLKKENYDLVVDFEQWSRSTALLGWAAKIPIRLGFDTPTQHRSGPFTHTVLKTYQSHELDEFYSLLNVLPNSFSHHTPELRPNSQGQAELVTLNLAAKLSIPKLKAVLHPGCGVDGTPREWPLPSYGIIGHWLQKKYGAILFLTGGPDERKKTKNLNRLLNRSAFDLGGNLSWEGMTSLLAQVDLVVSGNTGVMHLAAALKRKQVALHGPTNSKIWGPLNSQAKIIQTSCSICPSLKLGFEYHRKDQKCMALITENQVKKGIESLIDKNGPI